MQNLCQETFIFSVLKRDCLLVPPLSSFMYPQASRFRGLFAHRYRKWLVYFITMVCLSITTKTKQWKGLSRGGDCVRLTLRPAAPINPLIVTNSCILNLSIYLLIALKNMFFFSRKCHIASFVWCFGYIVFFRTTHYLGLPMVPAHANAVQLLLTLKVGTCQIGRPVLLFL